jgi:hypothetical protein
MATRKSTKPRKKPVKMEPALKRVTNKLADCKALRTSVIRVRATGSGGGDFYIQSSDKGVELVKDAVVKDDPTIEIMGDVRRIQSVLDGSKDARALFLAGAFRIHGDLRYFSDLALELGILKEPL